MFIMPTASRKLLFERGQLEMSWYLRPNYPCFKLAKSRDRAPRFMPCRW